MHMLSPHFAPLFWVNSGWLLSWAYWQLPFLQPPPNSPTLVIQFTCYHEWVTVRSWTQTMCCMGELGGGYIFSFSSILLKNLCPQNYQHLLSLLLHHLRVRKRSIDLWNMFMGVYVCYWFFPPERVVRLTELWTMRGSTVRKLSLYQCLKVKAVGVSAVTVQQNFMNTSGWNEKAICQAIKFDHYSGTGRSHATSSSIFMHMNRRIPLYLEELAIDLKTRNQMRIKARWTVACLPQSNNTWRSTRAKK